MGDIRTHRRSIAQRERELRSEEGWGVIDFVALPVAGIVVVVVLSLAILPGIVTLMLGRRHKGDGVTSGKPANREDVGS